MPAGCKGLTLWGESGAWEITAFNIRLDDLLLPDHLSDDAYKSCFKCSLLFKGVRGNPSGGKTGKAMVLNLSQSLQNLCKCRCIFQSLSRHPTIAHHYNAIRNFRLTAQMCCDNHCAVFIADLP